MAIDPTSPTSLLLLRRAHEGDSLAWKDLDARYRERLTALASYLIGAQVSRQAAPEDLVQQAWVGLLKNIDDFQYRGAGSLYAMLAQRIRSHALHLGRKGATRGVETALDDSQLRPIEVDDPSPSTLFAATERTARIAEHLASPQFPRPYAEALVAFYLEGRSGGELAKERKESPAAFHKVLSRARQRYRELFGGDLEALL